MILETPMGCAHTNFARGKRVLVTLRDGTSRIDWFVEARSKFIVLKNAGRVNREDLKSIQIPKGARQ